MNCLINIEGHWINPDYIIDIKSNPTTRNACIVSINRITHVEKVDVYMSDDDVANSINQQIRGENK